MSDPIFEAIGVNTKNFGLETSIVTSFISDSEKSSKFSEGLIQNVYKLENTMSLGNCDHLIASSVHLIYSIGNELYINSQAPSIHLKSPIISLLLHQNTLFLLHRDYIFYYNIPQKSEVYSLKLTENYKSIKINPLRSIVFLISDQKILRIENATKVLLTEYPEKITTFDLIIDSYDLIFLVFSNKKLQVLNYTTGKITCEHESLFGFDNVISVNDSVLILYSIDKCALVGFDFREKKELYTIVFNSRLPKKILFTPETEQLIVVNQNSCKLMILSLDENAFVAKFVIFGLKNPAKNIKCTVLENTIKNQPIYEGNSKHQIYVFHESSVDLYAIEVISTKTVGFRYGKEPEPLVILENSEIEPVAAFINPNSLEVLEKVKEFKQWEKNIEKGKNIEKEKKQLPREARSNPVQVQFKSEPIVKFRADPKPKVEKPELNPIKPELTLINPIKAGDAAEKIAKLVTPENLSNILLSASLNIKQKMVKTLENSTKEVLAEILAEPLHEIISTNLAPLQKSISSGFSEISALQGELSTLLLEICTNLDLKVPVFEDEPLEKLVKSKNKAKIQRKIQLLSMQEVLNSEETEDFWYDFGFLLSEIVANGDNTAISWLIEICKKVSQASPRFPEFYFTISKSSTPPFDEFIKILESKF